MKNVIPLDALIALDMIDKKGSFAAAAESLYKAPSSLTYTIKKLEDDIGMSLFDRSNHKAELTEAGKIVLKQGRQILFASEKLVESVRQFESGWERKLRIARDTLIDEDKLIDVCKDFEQLNKHVELSLTVEVLGGVWDALYCDKVDIVIGGSGEAPTGRFGTHKIGEISFVFAIAPFHPLASYQGVIKQEDLINYPSIVIADTSQTLEAKCSGYYPSSHVIRVSSIESKLNFQRKGVGVGFLPTRNAQPYIDSGELIVKSCEVAKPNQDIYIAWNKKQEGKALEWFIEKLCSTKWFE